MSTINLFGLEKNALEKYAFSPTSFSFGFVALEKENEQVERLEEGTIRDDVALAAISISTEDLQTIQDDIEAVAAGIFSPPHA